MRCLFGSGDLLAFASAAIVTGLPLHVLPAQAPPLILPKVSQRASVTQTIGLTEITIRYDRPGMNGREVWGKLVPYDSVWRAGANENTVLTVSSPVKVQGQPLAAGRYGIHMIPSQGDWTVIVSREASAWGSFSYDQKEDVLRVKATPHAADLRRKSFALATENEVNFYGYGLMGRGMTDSAIVVFRKNVKDHPGSWNTYDSLGEAYATKGDKKQAVASYSKALRMVGDQTQKKRIEGVLAQLR